MNNCALISDESLEPTVAERSPAEGIIYVCGREHERLELMGMKAWDGNRRDILRRKNEMGTVAGWGGGRGTTRMRKKHWIRCECLGSIVPDPGGNNEHIRSGNSIEAIVSVEQQMHSVVTHRLR